MRELLQYEYSRTLNQIADFLEIAHGSNNKVVTGITLNSQKIESGDLFIALQGAKTHGIQFLEDVVAAGAAAILTDELGFEIVREQIDKHTDSPVILTSKNLRGAHRLGRQKDIHRIRGRPAGRRGLYQRPVARHGQGGFHAVWF